VSTEWIVLVCTIKYAVTLTKEFTSSSSDRQLEDISEGGNTVLHENVYIQINLKNARNLGNWTKRTSELHERAINAKKRSYCHLFQRRM